MDRKTWENLNSGELVVLEEHTNAVGGGLLIYSSVGQETAKSLSDADLYEEMAGAALHATDPCEEWTAEDAEKNRLLLNRLANEHYRRKAVRP